MPLPAGAGRASNGGRRRYDLYTPPERAATVQRRMGSALSAARRAGAVAQNDAEFQRATLPSRGAYRGRHLRGGRGAATPGATRPRGPPAADRANPQPDQFADLSHY